MTFNDVSLPGTVPKYLYLYLVLGVLEYKVQVVVFKGTSARSCRTPEVICGYCVISTRIRYKYNCTWYDMVRNLKGLK